MKSITINVTDDIYQYIEIYSSKNGEDILTIFTKCCLIGFQVLCSEPQENSQPKDIETWKKERKFGNYGRRKMLSHSIC